MDVLIAAFGASFLFVALKAFQQLNVVHDQFLLVIPTSVGMAVCEVYVVANIALRGWHWPLVLAVGLGSGIGCVCSMWLHKRLRGKIERTPRS